jgi:hypothetical protein
LIFFGYSTRLSLLGLLGYKYLGDKSGLPTEERVKITLLQIPKDVECKRGGVHVLGNSGLNYLN